MRGGGLYALGFIATFVVLEVQSLADDVLGIGAVFTGQAFMWPIHIVQFAPPWGAVALGVAYMGFATYLKKPIEGWLFDDEPEAEGEATEKTEA